MPKFLVNRRTLKIGALNLFAIAVLSSVAFAQAPSSAPAPVVKASNRSSGKTANTKPTDKKTAAAQPSAEPDKVLYDRAMVDLKKSKFIEGRLALQTLINTYPDSEYLAKAKLGVADSYFKRRRHVQHHPSRFRNIRTSSRSSPSSTKQPTRKCRWPWRITR
jgi:TolA-binding protein